MTSVVRAQAQDLSAVRPFIAEEWGRDLFQCIRLAKVNRSLLNGMAFVKRSVWKCWRLTHRRRGGEGGGGQRAVEFSEIMRFVTLTWIRRRSRLFYDRVRFPLQFRLGQLLTLSDYYRLHAHALCIDRLTDRQVILQSRNEVAIFQVVTGKTLF